MLLWQYEHVFGLCCVSELNWFGASERSVGKSSEDLSHFLFCFVIFVYIYQSMNESNIIFLIISNFKKRINILIRNIQFSINVKIS